MSVDLQLLLKSTEDTLYMVFFSSVLSIICGLCIAILLFMTQKKGVWPQAILHTILNFIVNVGRSIPFVILMLALIPITRFIVGTSIGTTASIVPLTIAAIPFYARIAESAFKQVDSGLIDAAHSMGVTPWQLLYKVIIPESLLPLLEGVSLTLIALVSYSGVVGVMGGGGLGDVAIRYGYQRFNLPMMFYTIVILVILVQIFQWVGDYSSKKRSLKAWLALSVALFFISCLSLFHFSEAPAKIIRVGVVSGPQEAIMKVAAEVAKKQFGIELEPVIFTDYVLPNEALASGEIDANIFQHQPYLDTQIKQHHYAITAIGKTFVYPLGFYSTHIKRIQDLKQGDLVGIPNDPSNEGRALLLLSQVHLITLKSGVGLLATPADITQNPLGLHFKELDAADISRALPDLTMGALTNDYVSSAHFTVSQALVKEGPHAPYANIIVVQDQEAHNPLLLDLVKVMHSAPVVQETETLFPGGAAIPAES